MPVQRRRRSAAGPAKPHKCRIPLFPSKPLRYPFEAPSNHLRNMARSPGWQRPCSARLARPARPIRRHSLPHLASAIPAQAPPNRRSGPLAWCLRIAYPLATIASQSGRGQPHSRTLRDVRHVGARASVLECGCPLPLSPPQEVIVIVRHYTNPSGYPPDTLRMPFGHPTDRLTGAWPSPPNCPKPPVALRFGVGRVCDSQYRGRGDHARPGRLDSRTNCS